MDMLDLSVVFEALRAPAPELPALGALGQRVLTDAVIDSRMAIPGCLFIALPGEKSDGHLFVPDAFERGAAIALVQEEIPGFRTLDLRAGAEAVGLLEGLEAKAPLHLCLRVANTLEAMHKIARLWRGRLSELRVVGITGSVGKSTTKELVASVLSTRYATLASESSFNNEIGLPLTLLRATRSHRFAVLEMGFYVPGDIRLLCEISQPEIAIVTMIGPVHLERAGSLEAIARGKAELLEALPESGTAILNYDDERVRGMASSSRAKILFYGLSPEAELRASDVSSLGLEGIRFQVNFRGETLHLHVPLLGRHSVHTALRAVAVGLVVGLTWQEILEGLGAPAVQLRLVTVEGPNGSLIVDDTYNASPDSMIAALNLLGELGGHPIAVLGDMLELGGFEEQGHRMVGARAAEVVGELVTIGERARWIAEEAHLQSLSSAQISTFATAEDALPYLKGRIRAGDVVLVKGSHALRLDRIVSSLESDV
ncbi:MAG: UDP-N-acetylmuramoyl-tripeptide--D-alanyl-D-alanine ligase [Anaerolineales bacterium]|jgi:UDP-N-acetylmuramoyl-tripeptide--D-alanyl-D-alanine ligase